MTLHTFTISDIRALDPCYDPVTGVDRHGKEIHPGGFLPEGWTGTVLDILRMGECPTQDRVWVVIQLVDERTAKLFAVWCARAALAFVKNPDRASLAACDVAERYINGLATSDELVAARGAARDAAWEAAWSKAVTFDSAWDAIVHASRAAAYATRAAAWGMTLESEYAARAAVWQSAWELVVVLEGDASRDASWTVHARHLIEYLAEVSNV